MVVLPFAPPHLGQGIYDMSLENDVQLQGGEHTLTSTVQSAQLIDEAMKKRSLRSLRAHQQHLSSLTDFSMRHR